MSVAYGSVEWKQEVQEKREELEAEHGKVWNTNEVTTDFDITGFLAPRCAAIHKETGIKGTLRFTHSPRFYFDFRPASENEFAIWEEATKIKITYL